MAALWYNLLISIRTLLKNKYYLILNISGLAIALACSFLIYLWISNELSYDKFFNNYKDIYRVLVVSKTNNNFVKTSGTPGELAPALKLGFPEIAAATHYDRISSHYLKYNENSLHAFFRATDREFFNVFSFKFKEGDAKTAFAAANPIILTDRVAKILFGNKPSLGQTVESQWDHKYTVSAVVEMPENTHFDFDALILSAIIDDRYCNTYVRFAPGTFFTEDKKEALSKVGAIQTKSNIRLTFQPLSEIYINTTYNDLGNVKPHGSYQNIAFMSLIALVLLLVAGFNYLNLSTAQALKRLHEIGIKKVIGSLKSQIIISFFAEFFLISVLAFLLAFYIASLLVPVFNQVTGKHLMLELNSGFLLFGFVSILLIGLISVSYPAFYVSSLVPEKIFKQQHQNGRSSVIRQSFIVFQFAISLFIIVTTIYFNRQLNFINERDLGYDKENLINMPTSEFIYNYQSLREQLLKNPNIIQVSASANSLSSYYNVLENTQWEGKNPEDSILMYVAPVDPYYLSTTGLKMVKGEFFPESLTKVGWFKEWDSTYLWPAVINETAAKVLGFDDPVGKKINDFRIIGVIEDYHYRPLIEKIEPLILCYNEEAFMNLNIRFRPGTKSSTLSFIEQTSAAFRGNEPFKYSFLEDEIAENYKKEERVTKIFNYGSILSILLALSGVLGLISYLTESRRKEISLRKVNGAQSSDITRMFIIEFGKITLVAFLIGATASFFFLKYWLNNYAYRVNISFWIFLTCGVILLLLTSLTIFYQSYKIARENPVNNLKYE